MKLCVIQYSTPNGYFLFLRNKFSSQHYEKKCPQSSISLKGKHVLVSLNWIPQWHLRFSQKERFIAWSSGLWHHAVWYIATGSYLRGKSDSYANRIHGVSLLHYWISLHGPLFLLSWQNPFYRLSVTNTIWVDPVLILLNSSVIWYSEHKNNFSDARSASVFKWGGDSGVPNTNAIWINTL
jgi:hypothetical protein